jgi:hypothetical protein
MVLGVEVLVFSGVAVVDVVLEDEVLVDVFIVVSLEGRPSEASARLEPVELIDIFEKS